MISFTIPGEPTGKARPRVAQGHAYTPQQTKNYEVRAALCWQAAARQGGGVFTGPVAVTIKAYYKMPQSTPKYKRAALALHPPEKKPDADNVAKIVLDALNGLAYADDKQVTRLLVSKHFAPYGESGFVAVTLEAAAC